MMIHLKILINSITTNKPALMMAILKGKEYYHRPFSVYLAIIILQIRKKF